MRWIIPRRCRTFMGVRVQSRLCQPRPEGAAYLVYLIGVNCEQAKLHTSMHVQTLLQTAEGWLVAILKLCPVSFMSSLLCGLELQVWGRRFPTTAN